MSTQSWPNGATLRRQIYAGDQVELCSQGQALVEAVLSVVGRLLPRAQVSSLTNDLFLGRLAHARQLVRDDTTVRTALVDLLTSHHGLEQTLVDAPRLRVILPGAHRLAAAAPVYYAHRDTWYGNPRSQLNWWVPLHDVEPDQTFVFYPEAFDQPVPNNSHEFDYDRWRHQVGFATASAPPNAVYPRALGSLSHLQARGFAARQGDLVVFSAAHLHQTLAFDHGLPRLSLDFRTVYLPDHKAGWGAPDPDNASRGCTLADYHRLS